MTNGEKYKTTKERADAFWAFCKEHQDDCNSCPIFHCCNSEHKYEQFAWLLLDHVGEKPLPCPFCGGDVHVSIPPNTGDRKMYQVGCFTMCGYKSMMKESRHDAIAAHNRVAKAVNESEAAK